MKSSGRLLLVVALTFGGLAAAGQTTSWTTGTYVYDGSANIKDIGTQVYQYDALGRLLNGTVAPSQTQSVTYDAFGNIKTMTTAGMPMTFGVNPATNRMDRMSDPGVTYSAYAGYDTAGRMTSTLGGLDTFDYDAVDMVTRARVENVTRVYLYTAGDERLASIPVASGVESCLLISGQQICPEWTLRDASARVLRRLEKNGEAWSWKEDYIYAGGTLVAAEVDGPEKTRHFFADHLGTPRLITGSGGTQLAQHTYYPFGGEASSSTQDNEKLKFTGHERDAASLDYMHARYYAPKWGRFLSVDPKSASARPAMPQTWNRYSYALNNPIKYIDPDGHDVYIAVTNIVVGSTTVNSLPGGAGDKENVPAYKIVVMNEAGTVSMFSGSRDTNYEGAAGDTRGNYGSNHETPPGTYFGHIRTDGKLGARVELGDAQGGDSVAAPDGTKRQNLQIHVGPGCSQGCVLLTGGKDNRDSFIKSVEDMQQAERDAGRGDQVHVVVMERNGVPGGDVADEDAFKKKNK